MKLSADMGEDGLSCVTEGSRSWLGEMNKLLVGLEHNLGNGPREKIQQAGAVAWRTGLACSGLTLGQRWLVS